MTYYKNRAKFT